MGDWGGLSKEVTGRCWHEIWRQSCAGGWRGAVRTAGGARLMGERGRERGSGLEPGRRGGVLSRQCNGKSGEGVTHF